MHEGNGGTFKFSKTTSKKILIKYGVNQRKQEYIAILIMENLMFKISLENVI